MSKKTSKSSKSSKSGKTSSKSDGKSSQSGRSSKSSGRSSKVSSKSNSSGSELSAKSNFTFTERQSPKRSKTIYTLSEKQEGSRDEIKKRYLLFTITIRIITILQVAILLYIFSATIYQTVWGTEEDMWVLLSIAFFEIVVFVSLLYVVSSQYVGPSCFFLLYQFSLLFILFSFFIQSDYDSQSKVVHKVFSVTAVSFLSACVHLYILVQAIELIEWSTKRTDHSDGVIVEGVEKRRRDLYMMISGLITEICYDDRDTQLKLQIKDETGQTKTMRGAGVEAGVSRVLEMSMDQRNIHLSSNNTTLARIEVPKQNESVEYSAEKCPSMAHVGAAYNCCTKQDKILSPRKIL